MAEQSPSEQRLAWLDSLRAIASLSVMFHHFTPISTWTAGLFDFGRLGVLLFFLISGYCIALTIERPSSRPIVSFWVRRVFRLYPPYWAALLLVGLLMPTDAFSLGDWGSNLTMIQQILGHPYILGVAWTLFFELLFYCVASMLIPWGAFHKPLMLLSVFFLLLVSALLFAVGKALLGIPVPFSIPLFLSVFFAGALFRCIDRNGMRHKWPVVSVAILSFAVIAVISGLIFGKSAIGSDTWISHLGNHVAALALFVVLGRMFTLNIPVLVFLGHVSYSLYLVHTQIGNAIIGWLGQTPLATLAGMAVAIIVAILVYFVLERPAIKAGRRLVAYLECK